MRDTIKINILKCLKNLSSGVANKNKHLYPHTTNLSLLFPNYLPFGKCVALHLNKLESPLPRDTLCQFWLKLAQWFWRRRFFNFVNEFWLFHNYLGLEKDRALHFNKLESPSPKNALCQVWLKLDHWFLRRRLF